MGKRLVKNSPSDFYLEFDLKELLGSEVADDVAISFGQAVIDTILDRTANGTRSDGRGMKSYSDDYADSLEFQAAGKSKHDPNLELSGGMLADIDILEANPRSIRIGFRDTTERAKAYNHHTGDTLPERPFFDLNNKELSQLVKEFKVEAEESPLDIDPIDLFGASPQAQAETTRRISLLDLLDDMDGEFF